MNIGQIGQDYGASVTTGSEFFMTVSLKGRVVPVLYCSDSADNDDASCEDTHIVHCAKKSCLNKYSPN